MTRRLLHVFAVFLLLLSATLLSAEKVADLPIPTTYVNDFAHVLTPEGQRRIEDLSLEVHQQAGAELVFVTIKSLDDGQSIEEFTVQLEEKWKLGKKGEDRSALFVMVLNPHKLRVETGYGLEGILNDAKVGGILDQGVPFAKSGDYDTALLTIDQGLADVIAADRHVTLTPIVHQYHRQQAPQTLGVGQIVLGIGFVILILILIKTGHIGWAFYLVMSMMGGGGGGGGGRGGDDEGGGGFGGSGGGGSGGGGASRDF
jgi:uncharacterized protein